MAVTRRRLPVNKLETPTARLRLSVKKKPYCILVSPGIHVAYRRNAGAGVWSVKTSTYLKKFALADDYENANGETVMTFFEAQDKAREIARGGVAGGGSRPSTINEAIDAYAIDLKARGGLPGNASHIRCNISKALASKPVALLTQKELRDWRNGMVESGLKPASADRIAKSMKAALNLAASNDPRIVNVKAWKDGLKKLPDGENTARNVILSDELVIATAQACYEDDHQLGVLIEVLANTGARESQVLRVEVQDLLDDRAAPRLMMPSSKKGKSRKIDRKALPISTALAAVLRQAAVGRAPHDKLFDRIPYLSVHFRVVAKRVGLSDDCTPYCLRHSSIVRMLLAGIPTRVVASHHDTSIAMIEQHYSRYIIGDPSDLMVRKTLLDLTAPAKDNVVAITG